MKKKIIIFTSSGGGGHESAAKALDEYLQNDYEIVQTYIFAQALRPLDLLRMITFGMTNGEALYNFLIRKKYFHMLNTFASFGKWVLSISEGPAHKLIKNYLAQQKPDLIISVVPYVNNSILQAARDLNMSFILIPTDLDATNFVFKIHTNKYKKFWVISAFNDPEIKKTILSADIPETQLVVGGFPIRTSFFEQKNTNAIKKHYSIPADRPVIFMLMGATGCDIMLTFVQELHKSSIPLHLILVLGRNNHLKPKIEALLTENKITATLFNFTDKIADLMAVSDLCITKSGSVSVCEAIYSNLPILLDATSTVLQWEALNHPFIKEHGFGSSIESYADIAPLVETYLKDTKKYAQMKIKLEDFEKKNLETTLRQLLDDIFA